jgi:hypothetical protein
MASLEQHFRDESIKINTVTGIGKCIGIYYIEAAEQCIIRGCPRQQQVKHTFLRYMSLQRLMQ